MSFSSRESPSRLLTTGVLRTLALLVLISPEVARGQAPTGYVFDQFFRYDTAEHRQVFQEMPGETVDPFTGTLRVVQQDEVLPGAAGLDLRIVRSYSSKIWERADQLAPEPLLAEKNHSPLGYGWSFHFGRLRDPNVIPVTEVCATALPVFESQDGVARVFYPTSTGVPMVFHSKDYWRMERPCAVLGGSGVCVWSPEGIRYEFAGGSANQYFGGMTLFYPVTAVVEPAGNRIVASYTTNNGTYAAVQLASITDTYGRTVTFDYATGVDGDRLTRVKVPTSAGVKEFTYQYTTYQTVAGARRFLTSVTSPSGPTYRYSYNVTSTVGNNRYALASVTYPYGGTSAYEYGATSFYTGNDTVPFSVVTKRTVSGPRLTTGSWTYSYSSPSPHTAPPTDPEPRDLHVTTIVRPDGATDTHKIYGFGWLVGNGKWGFTHAVGLPYEVARGNRSEIEVFGWNARVDQPLAPGVTYSAPVYSGNCGLYVADGDVYAPALDTHVVVRDYPGFQVGGDAGSMFQTLLSDFDAFGQARDIVETGYNAVVLPPGEPPLPGQKRTTRWEYFSAPMDATGATVNILRGRPASQRICLGDGQADCVLNAWTYNGPGYQRDSESISGVVTRFAHFGTTGGGELAGNLASVTNAANETVSLSGYVAGFGRPSRIELPDHSAILRTATPEGWPRTVTDARGNTTAYAYDAIGRVLSVTPPLTIWPGGNPLPTTTTYPIDQCWTANPPTCSVTVTRGAYTKRSELDGLGRAAATSDAVGVSSSTQFDAFGRPTFESYPFDVSTGEVGDSSQYDYLGRIASRSRAVRTDNASTGINSWFSNSHNANCVQTTFRRGGGEEWYVHNRCARWYGAPDEQRPWEAIDGDYATWWFEQTPSDQLRHVYAPLSKGDREVRFDGRGFPTDTIAGETGHTINVPDAVNRVKTSTDARGVRATFDYDLLGRAVATTYGNGGPDDVSRTFDLSGNVTRVATPGGGIYDYEWDEVNRLRRQTWTTPASWSPSGPRTFVTTYGYDSAGCLTSIVYPTGRVLSTLCDSANRVTSVTIDGSLAVSGIAYHPSGQVKNQTYELSGNRKLTSTMTFDTLGRAKSISMPGTQTVVYGYDGADNMTSLCRDDGNGACLASPVYSDPTCLTVPATTTKGFCYDKANRLVTALAPDQWGTLVYDYDALGNRDFKSGYFNTTTDLTTVFRYDSKNRLDSIVGTEAFQSLTFTWSDAGRLASSSDGASYSYGGHGLRVRKSTATGTVVYHHDAGGRIIAETLADGTRLRDFIYLGNKLIAVEGCSSSDTPPCSGREWYATDTLGSVLARVNSNGDIVARFEYQPWGEAWTAAGPSGDRRYNGRIYDPGTGFNDYGARMYWPEIGRFISADPAGIHLENPQSWNRYAYVWNNPYKYVDPSGKEVDLQWHNVSKESFHTSIRITPENQDAYRNDSRFMEVDGKLTMTLGAGPDIAMRLKNAPNRENDAKPHPDTHSQIAVPSQYKNEDHFILALLSLDSAYNGNAPYFFFPGRESYNSNSYVSGLLNAAGAPVAPPPVSAPGWDRPLPASYFGVQKADDSAWRPAPSK